jgi:hypothetical protein
MFLTERAEDRSTKESRPFRMDGSSLLIEGPGGQTLRMDRVGGSSETTVLGAWRYKHYTGQIAFERFLPDGRMNFRLPMMSSSACYTMDAAGTSITLQGSKAVVMKFERKGEGDTLRLQSPGRSDASYVREPAGMWYEWPSR